MSLFYYMADYQNIGVNGARVTSSMQLVNSMARTPQDDNPVLLWFSLIGNDVCNGHPGFDHMTKPDDFYTSALASLNAIDAVVPKGSHVVALALFNGELLYDIMHDHQVGPPAGLYIVYSPCYSIAFDCCTQVYSSAI